MKIDGKITDTELMGFYNDAVHALTSSVDEDNTDEIAVLARGFDVLEKMNQVSRLSKSESVNLNTIVKRAIEGHVARNDNESSAFKNLSAELEFALKEGRGLEIEWLPGLMGGPIRADAEVKKRLSSFKPSGDIVAENIVNNGPVVLLYADQHGLEKVQSGTAADFVRLHEKFGSSVFFKEAVPFGETIPEVRYAINKSTRKVAAVEHAACHSGVKDVEKRAREFLELDGSQAVHRFLCNHPDAVAYGVDDAAEMQRINADGDLAITAESIAMRNRAIANGISLSIGNVPTADPAWMVYAMQVGALHLIGENSLQNFLKENGINYLVIAPKLDEEYEEGMVTMGSDVRYKEKDIVYQFVAKNLKRDPKTCKALVSMLKIKEEMASRIDGVRAPEEARAIVEANKSSIVCLMYGRMFGGMLPKTVELSYYRQAVSLDNKSVIANEVLAHALLVRSDTEGALNLAKKAISLDPKKARLANFVAVEALYRKNDIEGSLNHALELEKMGVRHYDNIMRIADIYYQKGDYAKASHYYERAFVLDQHSGGANQLYAETVHSGDWQTFYTFMYDNKNRAIYFAYKSDGTLIEKIDIDVTREDERSDAVIGKKKALSGKLKVMKGYLDGQRQKEDAEMFKKMLGRFIF